MIETIGMINSSDRHPFLTDPQNFPKKVGDVVENDSIIDLECCPYIVDHLLMNEIIIFPGTAYLEIFLTNLLRSWPFPVILENIRFHDGCYFNFGERYIIRTQFHLNKNDRISGSISVCLKERLRKEETWSVVATCEASKGNKDVTNPIDLDTIRARCNIQLQGRDFYEKIARLGYTFGMTHRGIHRLQKNENEAIGNVILCDEIKSQGYETHPAFLDACTHVGIALLPTIEDHNIYITAGEEKIIWFDSPLPEEVICYAKVAENDSPKDRFIVDLKICAPNGSLLVEISGYSFQKLPITQLRSNASATAPATFLKEEWKNTNFPEKRTSSETQTLWIAFTDDEKRADSISSAFADLDIEIIIVLPGTELKSDNESHRWNASINCIESYRTILEHCFNTSSFKEMKILHLAAIGTKEQPIEELYPILEEVWESTLYNLMSILQAIDLSNIKCQAELSVITNSVYKVGENDGGNLISLVQSPLIGLLQTAHLEFPSLNIRHIDVDDIDSSNVMQEIFSEATEPIVIYRENKRFLRYLSYTNQSNRLGKINEDKPYSLHQLNQGSIDSLEWIQQSSSKPEGSQILVRIHATGLNFRDVMIAAGHYPETDAKMGLEGSGEIVAVGTTVTRYKKGDQVMIFSEGIFSNCAMVAESEIAPIPNGLSFSEAATIPAAFLTAYYSLFHIANISPGDSVLIHAAAGGVGSAAVQLAQNAGAIVYATAKESKWDYVRALGADDVFSSRHLGFASDIMNITNKEGVDIVVNSLGKDYSMESLSCLKSTGCFVELGARDLLTSSEISCKKPGIKFFALHLLNEARKDRPTFQETFHKLSEKFSSGELSPLQFREFKLPNINRMFRMMMNGQHHGKLILNHHHPLFSSSTPLQIHGAYIITGGLGGLGLIATKWMAENNAGAIYLIGRRTPSASVQKKIKTFMKSGTQIHIIKGDVTEETFLQRIFHAIEKSQFNLKGVVHTAGLADNTLIKNQSNEKFDQVLSPKIKGGWLLHQFTKNMNLEFFVCYSSITSVLSFPGTSSYTAANCFLNELCNYRVKQGLPGLSIGWGPWEAGMFKHANSATKDQWTNLGFLPINEQQGMDIFRQLLSTCTGNINYAPINRATFFNHSRHKGVCGRLEVFLNAPISQLDEKSDSKNHINREEFDQFDPEKKSTSLHGYLVKILEEITNKHHHESDDYLSFNELGVNSLTAVEFKNKLESDLGVTLPATLLFNYSTISDLCQYLLIKKLGEPQLSNENDEAIINTQNKATLEDEELDDLSEDALLKLLNEQISEVDEILG